jgi:very-short-patch-repair endonuclease
LPASEITSRDGIPITSKGRTAMDYCAVTPLWIAQEVIVEAVITKILRPQELFAVLDRSGGRGCPGTADLRTIATGLDDLEGLESMLELVVAEALDRARVLRFVRQHPLTCADGREVRLDFARPDIRLAVEANGARWHDTPARKRRTRERLASIEGTDWEVLDYGWSEGEDPMGIIREVEETVDRRERRAA